MPRKRGLLSLTQQWFLIAFLCMAPILIVTGYAVWSLFQQMRLQSEVMRMSEHVGDLQSAINVQLRELERNARQYRLLRDERFIDSYRQRKLESIRRVNQELQALVNLDQSAVKVDAASVADLQHPLSLARQLLSKLLIALDGERLVSLDDKGYSELLAELADFRTGFNQQISAYNQSLSDQSEQRLHAILWRLSFMGVITLPLTLLLIGLGFLQMLRPLRRLSTAIIDLGHGRWQGPIDIRGPKDFQTLGERLEWMREQLLETDRQKQAFLRHVSHELKTPLSAVLEAASLLEDEVPGPVNNHQREVLRILTQNSQNLQELIQQLLNYNVITHSFRLQQIPVNVANLCETISSRLDQKVSRHHVAWQFSGSPDVLITDPLLLEMILSNLLSNAFHFSPDGGRVSVRWGINFRSDRDRQAWLLVEDQGSGIEPADQHRIFKPFLQASSRSQGPAKGSGVGLAIVKESVTNLGGEIRLESKPGKGCRFLITFPVSEQR